MIARPLGAICWGVLLAALSAGSAQAVDLRFKPKVGEEHRFAFLMSGRMMSSGDSADASDSRREGSVRIHYALKALSETDEQTVVEVRQLDGEATLSAEGESATVTLSPVKATFGVDRRRQSELEDMEGDDPPESEGMPDAVCGILGEMEVGCGMWMEAADMLYLPKDPVEVGATWTHEQKWEHAGTVQTTEYKLEELTEKAGRKCAKIRAKWNTPYSVTDVPEGNESIAEWLRMEGLTTGEIVFYYDYENSLDVYIEGTMGSETKPEAADASTKMLLNMKISLVE